MGLILLQTHPDATANPLDKPEVLRQLNNGTVKVVRILNLLA
jgi:hypothetical protein